VNRLEFEFPFGVAKELVERGGYDLPGLKLLKEIAAELGPDCVFWDVGANIGVHTVELSRCCRWVVALEAQRVIFQLLCANVALNSCLNVIARWAVAGKRSERRWVPFFDYRLPGSFGSLEVEVATDEVPGAIDREQGEWVEGFVLDEGQDPLPQLIKLDVEGMELEVLQGGARLFERVRPVLWLEWIKSEPLELARLLWDWDYVLYHGTDTDWLARPRERPLQAVGNLEPLDEGKIPRGFSGGSFQGLIRKEEGRLPD
jgi:FkbM family methyltransferase